MASSKKRKEIHGIFYNRLSVEDGACSSSSTTSLSSAADSTPAKRQATISQLLARGRNASDVDQAAVNTKIVEVFVSNMFPMQVLLNSFNCKLCYDKGSFYKAISDRFTELCTLHEF